VQKTLEILRQDNPNTPLLSRDVYNARAAIGRNTDRVALGISEERPTIYSKPHPSPEERIRADLRTELANVREELEKTKAESAQRIAELEERLKKKDEDIHRYEIFVDICNQRVMSNRKTMEQLDVIAGMDGGSVPNGDTTG
jgi:hypothetical protein